MEKYEWRKELKGLYMPSAKEPVVVEVPPQRFLMTDGKGDPNTSPDFQAAMGGLYRVAYTLKFARKKAGTGPDFTVFPPEGLWWTPEAAPIQIGDHASLVWTLMIAVPDFVGDAEVQSAMEAAVAKEGEPLPETFRFEALKEGTAVQILHIGPYSEEGPTIERLLTFAASKGYTLRGKHHEIYLSDPRRTAPEKWKTVIRQPVTQKG